MAMSVKIYARLSEGVCEVCVCVCICMHADFWGRGNVPVELQTYTHRIDHVSW